MVDHGMVVVKVLKPHCLNIHLQENVYNKETVFTCFKVKTLNEEKDYLITSHYSLLHPLIIDCKTS